jgi:hypothetical protein
VSARWWAALLALLPAAALAAGDGGTPPAAGAVEALRPFVRTLGRTIEVYHYAYRPAIGLPGQGPIPTGTPFVAEYLARKSAGYWDEKSPTRPFMMAGGLYAAIDPVITRTFGGIGDRWALFQLTLPAGFTFVDVRGWSDNEGRVERFPPAVREQLAAAGCPVEFPSELLIGLESPACRALALEVMRSLGVGGLLYRYQGYEFAGCAERSLGAFIIVHPDRLERAQLLTSQSPGPAEATEAHLRVRQLHVEARGLGSVYEPPWPDLAAPAARERMAQWKKERLFGCGGHPEDRMPGAPSGGSGR